jgi:hypothetical protein
MPEPLSKLCPGSKVTIDPDILHDYAELAQYPMRVIADWSHVDLQLGSDVLANMLKTDVMTSVAMYDSLRGDRTRAEALAAAARHSLEKGRLALFCAVINVTQASRDTRNKFAHHIWGYCADLPNAFCLTDPLIVAEYRRELFEWNTAKTRRSPSPPTIDHTQVFAYRRGDLKREARDARRALRLVGWLGTAVGDHFQTAKFTAKLMAESDIAAAHAKALSKIK